MTKVQKKRLLNVARALRESKRPKLFKMDYYVYGEWFYSFMTPEEFKTEVEFCGTPACALGHYASRTDLQRLLQVEKTSGREHPDAKMVFRSNGVPADIFDREVQEHFGLDEEESEELFGSHGCDDARTPVQAARYIERFVRENP